MPYGSDPVVGGPGSGYGKDPAQDSPQQPPAQTPAQTRASLPPVLQGVSPPIQGNDPGAAALHGLIGVPVEAGRMVNEWGAKPLGWDLEKALPPSMVRGWERLGQQAQKGGGSQVAETIGSAAPFLGMGPLEALPWAGRVAMRSVLPSLLQPTQGPLSVGEKATQTVLGAGMGEGLHGLSWLAGTPLGKWALAQARAIAGTEREATATARDQLQRTVTGRATQLSDVAAQQSKRAAEEKAQQEAFETARAEHEKTTKAAAEVEQRNLARQQAVDRMNRRNELGYRGAQVQQQVDEGKRLDLPRQATQSLLNDARGLIGQRPLEMNLTRESAPQVLREVGGELDRIYRQMSFDPNQSGWLRTAQRVQQDIATKLRQDPNAQALWERVFQGKAFMPGLRAEAGARAPVAGVAPGVVRPPVGIGPGFTQRSLPTGELQGPMGTRSGPISGDQLSMLMSRLTRAQQEFGLAAQKGGGEIYRSIADGMRTMRESIEGQLDAKFPALAEQRQLANQAYFLTHRVMDAIDVHGVATPEQLLNAFKSAEGDTRFGIDKRYADIKDRLEAQHQQFTIPPDKPAPPTPAKGYDEPVPKVGKAPVAPGPLPDPAPVPLKVPKSTRIPTPVAKTDERLPAGTAAAAGHAASHLGRVAGIPLLGSAVRGAMHYGKPAARAVLRPIRDVSRAVATPAAIGTSQLTAAEMDRQKRRREQRERQRSE